MRSPSITCLLVSHRKPDYLRAAVASLQAQTYENWEAVLVDSGDLYDAGYFAGYGDPRIHVHRSAETEELRRRKAMAPWCFNECFRRGLVAGDLVTYLCDDDVWYPNAFATFAAFAADHPAADAMYASQDVAVMDAAGDVYITGERRATQVRGAAAGGAALDCQVDYLQFCHTRRVLGRLREHWPEGRDTEAHADGVFMERVGAVTPVLPIDIKVGQNRRTPLSTYDPWKK